MKKDDIEMYVMHEVVGEEEGATKIVSTGNFFTTSPDHEYCKRRCFKTTGLECIELNKEQHLSILLIVSNNMSFTLMDNESFRRKVLFLREDSPLVDRFVLRWTLYKLYIDKTKSMKDKFGELTGRFSIMISEWSPTNNMDFLGIRLPFIMMSTN